jgi:hypothetical protein
MQRWTPPSEKQLKEWRRPWKIRLIESMNPGEIFNGPADLSRHCR